MPMMRFELMTTKVEPLLRGPGWTRLPDTGL